MRLLFVADGRSPIALNWIQYFSEREHEVFLASPFACSPALRLNGLELVPVAFSNRARKTPGPTRPAEGSIGLRAALRDWLGPLTIRQASGRLRRWIEDVKPDLVHALRIPYEGMLAADAYTGRPLIVSVWGNDFTLHAPTTGLMSHYTSWTMQVADALHADCQRDIRLGKKWGFHPERPTLVTPGNGGIRTDIFHGPAAATEEPVVINPRGFRTYVRNDTFFRAIPLVLARRPDTKFVCASMAGEPAALDSLRQLGIERNVELLATMPHEKMGDVLRRGQIVVSMGVHDGTPNTLLEGMACGCLPIAGDLESIREWIRHGKNGLLVDPTSPEALAEAILEGLDNKNLRQQAAGINEALILERAEYSHCMAAVERFYKKVLDCQEAAIR